MYELTCGVMEVEGRGDLVFDGVGRVCIDRRATCLEINFSICRFQTQVDRCLPESKECCALITEGASC